MVAPDERAPRWTGHREPRNHLLGALTADDWGSIEPLLERVNLRLAQVVESAGKSSQWLHFPESAIIAVVTTLADGSRIEVGTVGNEGMCGLPAWLEADSDDGESLCNVAGAALRGRASDIIAIAAHRPTIRKLLSRYAGAYLGVVSQGTACNRIHPLEQRCARWLLMTHDRLANDELLLTRELLAVMLGESLEGATIAIQSLRGDGLIHASRDRIHIMDRAGLERVSCECYQLVRHQFDHIA
ncbi:MAG: Crp/Fnr family transcriptional regulator [Gemmatimonadota bacterium]|nr:Crp/Fnr family transcriptional regulator [Gemmatimonadota bacterium]